jgi:hypothetical protein
MKARKVAFLADGRFHVDTIELSAMTIDAALEHLGISKQSLSEVDTVCVKDGDVIVEIGMPRPWTWNRFVFIASPYAVG